MEATAEILQLHGRVMQKADGRYCEIDTRNISSKSSSPEKGALGDSVSLARDLEPSSPDPDLPEPRESKVNDGASM